ncbi:hypothetical protein [Hahella ganghwensis]|uniref:hypothetical protein n=1 Tax=Hahella ganghwensis TaxID=286420 RepID=UPI0003A56B0C|nr:hypothetical protein [Hahella ganghwensis]
MSNKSSKHHFTKYADAPPKHPGWYIWRCEHKQLKGVVITFIDKFRKRGAGHTNVLSPSFDYWNGYQVLVPNGLDWAPYEGSPPKQNIDHTLNINELTLNKCPFCNEVPRLTYSGRFIGASPLDSTDWRLKCCSWITGPRIPNPVYLIEQWNKKTSPKPGLEETITPEMKAACIGEFTVQHKEQCFTCLSSGAIPECEVCRGEETYTVNVPVPWATMKDIYKAMLSHSPAYKAIQQLENQL